MPEPPRIPKLDSPDHGPVPVGLVQVNNSFSGQNYFPYSVGLLQAYAQRHLEKPSDFEFLLPIYSRAPIEQSCQLLERASVVFFSTYVWNIRYSIALANRIKQQRPGTLIIFGGPQVPNHAEEFLRANPCVDVACHGEGEQTFLAILRHGISGNWEAVPSISYLTKDLELVQRPAVERLRDLLSVPSPFLEGTFEPLIAAYPKETWIAMWETNRGCPFSCTFCDWGSATQSKVYQFDLERIFREIDWFSSHRIEFIFCADANFGILQRDLDIVRYAAEVKAKTGYPRALSVQNTKNATERAYLVQKTLADAGLNKGVTISLQSTDPSTLEAIKRSNISTASFKELQRRFTRDRVETYSDVILGLPGETYDSFADGVSEVISNGQHNRIQFNNLSILPNAEMGDPAYQKKYGMKIVESKVVNVHGTLTEDKEEIPEIQHLVVATSAMPAADWVRARAFSWMTALLHFDKVLQIPLIVLHETTGLSYRELIEIFSEKPLEDYPILNEVRGFFQAKARDIQTSGTEYCRSESWLNMWWPADELIFIKLSVEGNLASFYSEAERLLAAHLRSKFLELPVTLLSDSIKLNSALIKQPFQTKDLSVDLSFNIWEFYLSVPRGHGVTLIEKPNTVRIDRTTSRWTNWDDWCREVVWYGNKKGAYLYASDRPDAEIAGHT